MISDATAYVLTAVAAATRKEASLPVPEGLTRELRAVLGDAARHDAEAAVPDPTRVGLPRILVGEWLNS